MIEEQAKILLNQEVAHKTFRLVLSSPRIASMARPGQFVMIRVAMTFDPLLRRPLSICAAEKGGRLHILFRVVGGGTEMLSRLCQGEPLSLIGPLGRGFEFPRPGAESLLVGGGMGIAPLLFLANQLQRTGATVLVGYRTSQEGLDLKGLGLASVPISVATEDGTSGHHGLVTDLLKRELDEEQDQAVQIYTCGPVPMMKRVWDMASNLGIPCQVSLESLMACGLGACLGCAVRAAEGQAKVYVHVCKDGPVFDAGILDWRSL